MIRTKRVYESPDSKVGPRYLVDRSWLRGIGKKQG